MANSQSSERLEKPRFQTRPVATRTSSTCIHSLGGSKKNFLSSSKSPCVVPERDCVTPTVLSVIFSQLNQSWTFSRCFWRWIQGSTSISARLRTAPGYLPRRVMLPVGSAGCKTRWFGLDWNFETAPPMMLWKDCPRSRSVDVSRVHPWQEFMSCLHYAMCCLLEIPIHGMFAEFSSSNR